MEKKSRFDLAFNNTINVTRNQLYIVAHELKDLSERYFKKAIAKTQKGKCPGDYPLVSDCCYILAMEMFRAIEKIEKENEK